tara:strand:+ start:14257 stop:14667 length:411 start_codon:yes stop_codon:yes gene_type:complete
MKHDKQLAKITDRLNLIINTFEELAGDLDAICDDMCILTENIGKEDLAVSGVIPKRCHHEGWFSAPMRPMEACRKCGEITPYPVAKKKVQIVFVGDTNKEKLVKKEHHWELAGNGYYCKNCKEHIEGEAWGEWCKG